MNKKWLALIAIIAFAAYMTVNFLYLPLNISFVDEKRFISEAKVLYETGEFRHGICRSWEMPITGIIYSAFWGATKSQEDLIILARTFQACLLLLQAFMMYGLYSTLFKSTRGAFLTFICIAFYPYFMFYQGLLISETIFNTFLVAGFYFFYKWYSLDYRMNRHYLIAHLCFVLAVYTKAVLSFLPILFFITVALFVKKLDKRKRFQIVITSILLYCALMSPWWVRNYVIFGEFVPYSTSATMNLYLGNNKANISGGAFWATDSEKQVVERINALITQDELAWSRAYSAAAMEFVKENPKRALELAWMKFIRYWNVMPNAEEYKSSIYKWVSILSFGPVLLLAILSLFINVKKWRVLSPLYILVICFTMIHVISIASLRYRLPLEPFLILLAVSVIDSTLYKGKHGS